MDTKHDHQALPELHRIGLLIRNERRRVRNPIPKLAGEVGLTVADWYALEQGRLKLSFLTLTKIFDLLDIPLERVFKTKKDDFFQFVRLTWGEDPADLTAEEAVELNQLYVDLLEFRCKRSKVSAGPGRNSKERKG